MESNDGIGYMLLLLFLFRFALFKLKIKILPSVFLQKVVLCQQSEMGLTSPIFSYALLGDKMFYYLIGIKGSGMSALAKILLDLGHKVRGSDIPLELYTISNNDIIIDTLDNTKYDKNYTYIIGNAFKEHKITLKLINEDYNVKYYSKFVNDLFSSINIAISGTHGKTTTAKFLSCLLPNASYLIGDSTGHGEDGEYFIYEACEYKDNFLNYTPDILFVSNIDYDHPDYFKGVEDTFLSFNKLAKKSSVLITNGDYYYSNKLENDNKITYGFRVSNDCSATYKRIKGGYLLSIRYFSENVDIKYPFYGEHMIYNFLGVYTIMRYLGFNNKYIINNMDKLMLPKRRGEVYKGKHNYLICDYAHHPNEIMAFYESISENPIYKGYKKVIIFEPHTITRLEKFKEEYREVLNKFDEAYLYPIFTSIREKYNEKKVSDLYEYLNFNDYDVNIKFENSVICFVGAGAIDKEFNRVKYLF